MTDQVDLREKTLKELVEESPRVNLLRSRFLIWIILPISLSNPDGFSSFQNLVWCCTRIHTYTLKNLQFFPM